MFQKFSSTHVFDGQDGREKQNARALRLAFGIAGQLVAGGWIQVDFSQDDWHEKFALAVEEIADVVRYNQ